MNPFSLRLVPPVTADVLEATLWYDRQSPGLGSEFLLVLDASVAELARNPLRYPIIAREYRRHLTRRFPYAIYYRLAGQEVIVLGVFHCSRNPKPILRSLGAREQDS